MSDLLSDRVNNTEYNGNRNKAPNILKLDEVKAWLNIKDGETKYDFILNLFIEHTSQEFENYIDNPIITRQFNDIADGDTSDSITPLNKPVRKINHVLVDPTAKFIDLETDAQRLASSRRISEDAYFIDASGSVVLVEGVFSVLGTLTTGYGKGTILVDYQAGYATNESDVPSDIKIAAFQRVENLYYLRENKNLNVTSKATGNNRVNYALGLPAEISAVLDRYVDYSFDNANTNVRKYQTF